MGNEDEEFERFREQWMAQNRRVHEEGLAEGPPAGPMAVRADTLDTLNLEWDGDDDRDAIDHDEELDLQWMAEHPRWDGQTFRRS